MSQVASELADPQQAWWIGVDACPSCGSVKVTKTASITRADYEFCSQRVPVPPELRICTCECGLSYKNLVPSSAWLTALTAAEQQSLWTAEYGYGPEIAQLRKVAGSDFSVLDAGAAGGAFLRAVAPLASRRSALDIVRFDKLQLSDDGEFITAFLETPDLQWSHQAYDLVTAFDVFEHFYDPRMALQNLAQLVRPGGKVMLETGDAGSVGDLGKWYYTSLFEHHIFWDRTSLERIAGEFGFRIETFSSKFHKTASGTIRAPAVAKRWAYLLSPGAYHAVQKRLRFDGSIPPTPGCRDHMQVILRREG